MYLVVTACLNSDLYISVSTNNDLQRLTSDEFILSYDNESCQRMMKKNQIEKKKSDR